MGSEKRCAGFKGLWIFSSVFLILLAAGAVPAGGEPTAAESPRTVRAAILYHYLPDFDIDRKTGAPTGFSVEIMNEVAKYAGLKVSYVYFDEPPMAIEALREGYVDIIPGLGIAPERRPHMNFTRPFNTSRLRIFVRQENSRVQGLDDLAGRHVAVVAGSSGHYVLQRDGRTKLLVFRSQEEAFFSLMTGEADAFVYLGKTVRMLAKRTGLEERIKAVGEPLREISHAIAVRKGDTTDLLPRLDAALATVIASPSYPEIYRKWFGTPESYWNTERIVKLAILLLGLMALTFVLAHYLGLRRLNRALREALARERQVEDSLRESETRHRQLVDSSLDLVWEVDEQARYTYVSPRIREILGYEPEAVIGRSPFEFMPEEEVGRVLPELEILAAAREPFRGVESVHRHREGHPVILETNAVPILDGAGVFRGYRGTDRDITLRRNAERQLAVALRHLQFHVTNSPLAVVEFDRDYRVISWSKRAEAVFGWRAEEVLGRRIDELRWVHEDDAEAVARLSAEMFAAQRTTNVHVNRNYRKDGTVITCEWYNSALIDPVEGLVSIQSLVLDVTERCRAEEERSRLVAAIEQSGELVLMTDAEGLLEYVNPAFEAITGYRREEVQGQPLRFQESDTQEEVYGPELLSTVQVGGTWKGRIVQRRKDGGRCDLGITLTVLKDSADRIAHYVVVGRDITEQLKLERLLAQAQKMEAIGTLAGGIAHDFNNILGTINGYTELSLAKLPPESRVCQYLEQIHAASQRAVDLVRQILQFSRQTEKAFVPFNVVPLVKETVKMLRELIPSTIRIELDVRTTEDTLFGDATQIYQVLMNLCTNAYQAMKQGGLLEITLTGVTIGEGKNAEDRLRGLPPGPYLEIAVRDTGEGIDPVIRERIFDPFFTTKGIGEGTGLGLSVVHGIVSEHRGSIRVESQVGEGTAFFVHLPLYTQPWESPALETDPGEPDGEGRILVVDDEGTLAGILREVLEERGYAVVARTDSEQALVTFLADPDGFDLAITDQIMPKMTGTELAKSLREVRPGLPVILCTGFIDAALEKETEKIGIGMVLAKPVETKRLLSMVRKLIVPSVA